MGEGRAARVVRVQTAPPDRIFLWLRKPDGSKARVEVLGFRPHFWVPGEGPHRTLFGEPAREVVVPDFRAVPEIRAGYPRHFEADIPYSRRFLIDTGVRSGVALPDGGAVHVSRIAPADAAVPPRRCYVDIEVLGEGALDVSNAPAPIVSFSAWDSYTQRYTTLMVGKGRVELDNTFLFGSERELLRAIDGYFRRTDPDVVIGWNINYDVEYLRNRSRKVLPIFLPTETFDLKKADQRLHRRLSYELKEVALEEGLASGEPADALEALERYERGDLEFLARYNRDDVRFTVELDRKYGITEFFEGLKDYSGVAHYEDTLKFSVMDDTMLLRLARELGVVLPSAPDRGEAEEAETYEGALVDFFTRDGSARKGIFEGVAVFDFSRYYPSIILSLNLSPETKGSKEKIGIIPKLIERLFAERDKIEAQLRKLTPGTPEHGELKRKRDVVKFLTNSLYGVMAFPLFRLYDRDLAASVTEAGRKGLRHMADFVRDLGYEPLYGDSDSIMVQIPLEEAHQMERRLTEEMVRYFREEYGVRDPRIAVDMNYYARRILFVGVKKRYAAHVVYEHAPCDYIRVAGFETIRTDQSKFTKEVQRRLLDLILRGSREDAIAFAREALESFRRQPLERIAFRKGIEKPLDQYGVKEGTGVPAHVRAAIWSNKYLGTHFGAGTRPAVLYVKGVLGKPPTDVVAFERRAPDGCVVDWERMEDLTLRSKISGILEAAGIPWEEVEGRPNGRQRSLADFL
jgi:DNA polymerase I